jgi:uncharacterized membrane protein
MGNGYERRRGESGHAGTLVHGLGWVSVGLGIALIVAPRTAARCAGLNVPSAMIRACGVRKLACGIGILTQPSQLPWIHARIAGDALDLVGLAAAAPFSSHGGRLTLATAAVGGITVLDVNAALALEREAAASPAHVKTTIAVNKSAEELYRFWRNFENLPRIMPHLKSVEPLDATRSRWAAAAPAGLSVEWVADLIDDRPGERLAWRSVEGSQIYNAGSVRFDPAPPGHGTFVTVELLYEPPAGRVGAAVAWLFGRDAGQEVRADLRAFKQLMETGEVATTEGQPQGHAGSGAYDFLARIVSYRAHRQRG